ncbi:XRE family transcriptional regulator, partial [Roseomonas sp. DSM 102946]|nr:XRE family transcriptional regulator [Roseomonas sp. DSM 102946]
PTAARAMLALYRALRVAREDAGGIALPSGRRLILPTEEARDFFQDRANHFPLLEEAAEAIGRDLAEGGAESGHAIGERLRTRHGVSIFVGPTEGNLRHY